MDCEKEKKSENKQIKPRTSENSKKKPQNPTNNEKTLHIQNKNILLKNRKGS